MAAAQGKTVIAGTPYYMSPEHWTGKSVDGRSDIYSLGVTLYKVLTGVYPFEGNTPQILMKQHVKDRPRSPKALNPNISDGLSAIVGMMMAKNPATRYQNADELLADFDRLDSGEDPTAMVKTGKTVKCPFCGTVNPAHERKCTICGEYLLTKGVEVLLIDDEFQCPRCKAVMKKGQMRCGSCETVMCARCKKRPAGETGFCRACQVSVHT
jgi:serine/threonine protein kinase